MNSASAQALSWASTPPPAPTAANDNYLVIDLFAGGGGASTAIEQCLGRSPDIAVNHDEEALALHEANHPKTLHIRDDIRKVDIPALLVRFGNRPVGLLWASPDCKDHSKAKGGVPKDKNIRGLAWEVLRWVAAIRRSTGYPPAMIALENVEEFQDWGPLHTQGKRINTVQKKRRKETFRLWCEQLRSLGGVIEWREVIAAKFGAPTTRKRLFVIVKFDGSPIRWPEATHGVVGNAKKKGHQGDLFGVSEPDLLPEGTAAQCIDWNLPVPSIFARLRPLAAKTMRRIARGIDRFVISAAKPFLIPVTHSTGGDRTYSVDEPTRTATTSKGGDFQLVSPGLLPVTHQGDFRIYGPGAGMPTVTGAHRGELAVSTASLLRTDMQSAAERNGIHSAGEPVRTITSGGGFALASAYLVPHYSERTGQAPRVVSVSSPMPAVVPHANGGSLANVFMQKMSENGIGYLPDGPLHTAMAGAPRHYQVAAYLARQFGSTVSGRSLAAPHPAVMSGGAGGKSQVVTTTLQAAHIGRQFGRSIGSDAFSPMGVVMAGGGGKTQVVSTTLARAGFVGGVAHGDDRPRAGLRAWSLDDQLRTVSGSPDKAVVTTLMAPILDKYYATGVAQNPDRPIDAITAKARFGLGAAYIEQANTGVVGREASRPISTITSTGSQQRLIQALATTLPAIEPPWVNSESLHEDACAEIGAPAGARRRAVLDFLWEHFGHPTSEEWADPLATHSGRLRFGLVVIDEIVWQIVDIGMRMLTPRELYNAQGFPANYQIEIMFKGKKLTKTAQTRMAGNSVSPPPARAILEVNVMPEMKMRMAA